MGKLKNCFTIIPLELYGTIQTSSGRDCFILIFYRCKLNASFKDIKIQDKDKKMIGLERKGYYRGIRDLEKCGLISVVKGSGKAYRISVNLKMLHQNTIDYILKKKSILTG